MKNYIHKFKVVKYLLTNHSFLFSYFYILKKWLEGSTTKQDLENVERMGMMHG